MLVMFIGSNSSRNPFGSRVYRIKLYGNYYHLIGLYL